MVNRDVRTVHGNVRLHDGSVVKGDVVTGGVDGVGEIEIRVT